MTAISQVSNKPSDYDLVQEKGVLALPADTIRFILALLDESSQLALASSSKLLRDVLFLDVGRNKYSHLITFMKKILLIPEGLAIGQKADFTTVHLSLKKVFLTLQSKESLEFLKENIRSGISQIFKMCIKLNRKQNYSIGKIGVPEFIANGFRLEAMAEENELPLRIALANDEPDELQRLYNHVKLSTELTDEKRFVEAAEIANNIPDEALKNQALEYMEIMKDSGHWYQDFDSDYSE